MCPYYILNNNTVYYPPIKNYPVYEINLINYELSKCCNPVNLSYAQTQCFLQSYQQQRNACQEWRRDLLEKEVTIWYFYDSIYCAYSYSAIFLGKDWFKGYIEFIFSFVFERENCFVRSPSLSTAFFTSKHFIFERNVQLYQASIYTHKRWKQNCRDDVVEDWSFCK